MSDLPTLHGQARRLIMRLHEGLEKCEGSEVAGKSATNHLQRLSTELTQLQARLQDLRPSEPWSQKVRGDMDSIWRMHVLREAPSRRDVWKRKVEQVSDDLDAIQNAMRRVERRVQRREREDAEREELFARRADGAAAARQLDEESQLASSIQTSKTVLEEAFQTGTQVLESMAGNRELFKRTQKRMLDALNTMGLSESLLRVISKRQITDARLTYGGMVVVALVVLGLYWWILM